MCPAVNVNGPANGTPVQRTGEERVRALMPKLQELCIEQLRLNDNARLAQEKLEAKLKEIKEKVSQCMTNLQAM